MNKLTIYSPDNMGISMPVMLIILLLAAIAITLLILLVQRTRALSRLQQSEKMRTLCLRGLVHEFRSPLTIIQGLSRHLREVNQTGNNNHTYLGTIDRQARILNDLANRMQVVTGYETADAPDAWKHGNVVAFLEMVAESYQLVSRKKGVEMVFFSEESQIETDYHPSHLQHILQLLLNKALESSREGSRIFLIVERQRGSHKNYAIKVVDHGKGISKKELSHLFEPCYREDITEPANSETALMLSKQLVTRLKGNIRVNSSEGKGTTFTLQLPIRNDKAAARSEETSRPLAFNPSNEEHEAECVMPRNSAPPSIHANDPRELILLVEENNDMAGYLSTLFHPNRYNLLVVPGGTMAHELALNHIPDIVIADSNTSQKSGLEVCRSFHSSPLLNHIPVIILSARNTLDDRLEALQSGADAYLSKPFRAEELQLRVEKLLESRNLLREKYQRAQPVNEMKDEPESQQLEFLRQVTDIIHREIRNQEFSPKMLADELAISLSQLNRRLNSIAGKPSSTYILQVKMAHARKILASQQKAIGEVAAECGIYDVNYFSRIFKKHTGVTPTQYQRLPSLNEG